MEILREEVVFDGRFIAVSKVFFKGSDGSIRVWEKVKRKTLGKIVSICAITTYFLRIKLVGVFLILTMAFLKNRFAAAISLANVG